MINLIRMKSPNKFLPISLIISLAFLVCQCDTNELYLTDPIYLRSSVSVGIIDIDDNTIYDAAEITYGYRDTL